MALSQQHRSAPDDSEINARRNHDGQVDFIKGLKVEIEVMEGEPTIQQQRAYEHFWRLFIDRVVREQLSDKKS